MGYTLRRSNYYKLLGKSLILVPNTAKNLVRITWLDWLVAIIVHN